MLKDRKKPTDHRQGNLVKLLDLMQRFSEMHHDEEYWIFDENNKFDEGHINQKYQEELDDMMRELRDFDVVEIGNMYLTSGGRIVLDKGCGEYFGDGDTPLFTLKELTSGMHAEKFIDRLRKAIPPDVNDDIVIVGKEKIQKRAVEKVNNFLKENDKL